MKIALVTPYSWSTAGGVNAHVEGLAEQLRADGHQAVVLAPADGPTDPGVVRLGRTVGIPFNGSVARLAFGPRVAARLRVALGRIRPDIVHVHEPFAPSASLLATLVARAPIVATFHASIDSRLYHLAGVPLRPVWRRLAAKIAVSDAARAAVESVFEPGCRVIPNGVDVGRYGSVPPALEGSKTVLYLGRLERRKGAHVLIGAVPRLVELVPDVRVVVAGDGPARAELERAVPPRFRDVVRFTGRFDEAERLGLLASATVACLPATGGESFGYTLVEAMAAGRPVVASAIPGYGAIVRDGVDGVLVPPGDATALAEALAAVIAAPTAARRMGEASRERARRFDWPIVAAAVEEVYRSAAMTRTSPDGPL